MGNELLPEGWCWVALEEIADPESRAIVSGPFGSNIGRRFFVDYGVPVIRGNNLTTDMTRFIDDGFVFVTEEKANELSNCEALPDDLVFTAAGSLGQVGIIPRDASFPRYIISNKQLRARLDKRRVEPLFAFYWFSSPRMVAYIQQRNTGSSVPLINLGILRSLPMPLPPRQEQQAIACILGALDDKIELNRRMNETLEGMARAIFKSWFVDFDPVRAKLALSADGTSAVEGAAGRQPLGLATYIADLFPDSFKESRLGEVPDGWDIGILEDLLVLQRGFDLPRKNRIPGAYQVIAASGPSTYHNEAKVKGPGVVTGRSGVLGKVFLVQDDFWPLNTALWVKEFKGSKPYHAYFILQRLDLSIFNAGSAVPTLNRNHVHSLPVVLPSPKVIDRFESIAELVFGKMKANDEESGTLAALRDTLLPKLISGELRVPDVERLISRQS